MLRRGIRQVLTIASVLLPFSAAAAQPAVRASDRPNVVLILMDDLGYGDIGSYGVKDAKTPNLDRLAREGIRLTDAYANGANCSPTRAGLISGQYQQRYGIEWPLGADPGDVGGRSLRIARRVSDGNRQVRLAYLPSCDHHTASSSQSS